MLLVRAPRVLDLRHYLGVTGLMLSRSYVIKYSDDKKNPCVDERLCGTALMTSESSFRLTDHALGVCLFSEPACFCSCFVFI